MGPGDVIYMPSGYLSVHRVMPGHDFGGFRISAFSLRDLELLDIFRAEYNQSGKKVEVNDEVMAFIQQNKQYKVIMDNEENEMSPDLD